MSNENSLYNVSNNLDDVILTVRTNTNKSPEINFNFIYNNYVESETSIDDSVINDKEVFLKNGILKNHRFIRIDFEDLGEDLQTNFSNQSSRIKEILGNLNQENINKNEREYFNKQDNLFQNRKSLILDNKLSDFTNYSKTYDNFSVDFDEEQFNTNDRSSLVSIANDALYTKEFVKKNYVENFNFNNLSNYEKIISNEKIDSLRRDQGDNSFDEGLLFANVKHISNSLNVGDINQYANMNAYFCGVYIEKFIKVEDEYRFLGGLFKELHDKSDQDDFTKIEDKAVRYGSTYRYACYNVYFHTTVSVESRFILNHFLLCSNPYMSNDIVCKEFTKPPEPVSLQINYNKHDKNLILTWESPTNYEGDVKGFQILKRKNINEPYRVVKQLEGHLPSDFYENNENLSINDIIRTPGIIKKSYIDESYNENEICMYTIRAIDAHGMLSNYGEQIGIYYDFLSDNLLSSLMANSGADVLFPNSTLLNKSFFHENISDYVDNLPTVLKPKKISLYFTPDFVYINKDDQDEKIYDSQYQLSFTNLNDFSNNKNNFSIVNFG